MSAPEIRPFAKIEPYIYSWRTSDVPKYAGWEKIGYTERQSVEKRVGQQASQLKINRELVWKARAVFNAGGYFRDSDFHAYLRQQGVTREAGSEWFDIASSGRESEQMLMEFTFGKFKTPTVAESSDYSLRSEQHEAIAKALTVFGFDPADPTKAPAPVTDPQVLWNAKPRFGKTLATYDLARRMGVRKVLIVTNRPAVGNSWFDDYIRFIGHQTTYKFVSDSASLSARTPWSREQWKRYVSTASGGDDPRIIEFLSLQDLKGSKYFGGVFDKLKHVTTFDWDLLVIDEAHEGIDTSKTDVAFDHIKRKYTLHLSGTPFKALASGKFTEDQVYNWTYENECEAREAWADETRENPYAPLPRLNLLTYQLSRMIAERLDHGAASDDDDDNLDFAFDLAEFFSVKENGTFVYADSVNKFLDCLTTNEKYPFSTEALRSEIRHSFWLLNRVDSAKALEKLLAKHPVFGAYKVILAAGDGKTNEDETVVGQSLQRVTEAINQAEVVGANTITLSVGQLTTGVTIPEWTAVVMLANLSSPALYFQAAFRAQNPCTFERDGNVYAKENAYIFDFAPERTLTIYDEFANNLNTARLQASVETRQDSIRRLLNFFPVIGEDSEGRMIELDASDVLTFPQANKAREVVRRGFMSNLLFDNVSGIFRYAEQLKVILDKLPAAKEGQRVDRTGKIVPPDPPIATDRDGNVVADTIVINEQIKKFAPPSFETVSLPPVTLETSIRDLAKAVTEAIKPKRQEIAAEYGMTATKFEADTKRIETEFSAEVRRVQAEQMIKLHHIEDDLKDASDQAVIAEVVERKQAVEADFAAQIASLAKETVEQAIPTLVRREESKKEKKRADTAIEDARAHLRGFARTIPMFLMAYGDADMCLANLDDYTDDDVFHEVTGITEAEFRSLRDGQIINEADGTKTEIPGLFDTRVFDLSIVEFLNKKAALADYFDTSLDEDIFSYIPQQKTSLVFTPRAVVEMMVDKLEERNPDIFLDSTRTFADLFSKAGMFIMELVRRLDKGLEGQFGDRQERLRHILTKQVYTLSPNEILRLITVEAVSGGDPERKQWIEDSGHFQVGELAKIDRTRYLQTATDLLEGIK